MANFGNATPVSKKSVPMDNQTIVEVVVKSPKSLVLSVRCRVICAAKQMLALTAVTPDNLDDANTQALDKMFAGFHFK